MGVQLVPLRYASGEDFHDTAGGGGGGAHRESRTAACLSELVYLLCFTALFLLFFGTPGAGAVQVLHSVDPY
jgi:hypothetical protein